MGHEDLAISQLGVGSSIRGLYRGQRTHWMPSIEDKPEAFLARVFLDTDDGPAAVAVNEHAIAQIEALDVADGDSIIIARPTEHMDQVVREVPD